MDTHLNKQIQFLPIANPDVIVLKKKSGKIYLLEPVSGTVVSLNSVGFTIWKQINGTISLSQVTESLKKNFTDIPTDVLDEINDFLSNLVKKGFIGFSIEL